MHAEGRFGGNLPSALHVSKLQLIRVVQKYKTAKFRAVHLAFIQRIVCKESTLETAARFWDARG